VDADDAVVAKMDAEATCERGRRGKGGQTCEQV